MTLTTTLLILALFALLIALPFIPGVLFMKRRGDDQPLRVDPEYSRDPLFFGQELRGKYESLVVAGETGLDGQILLTQPQAHLTPSAQFRHPLLVTGSTTTEPQVTLEEAYLQGGGQLGADNHVNALIADHHLKTGERLQVKRFVEVKGDLSTAAESNLGISAAATGKLVLQPGTQFQRLYGQPVLVEGDPIVVADPVPSVGDEFVWAGNSLRIPHNQVLNNGVICHGPLHIGTDSTVLGDVKVYGDLHLMPGAYISGNVVVRGSVILHGNNTVQGHLHTEKHLFVGSGSVLGNQTVQQSFYVAGRTVLAPGVTIYGYLVADRGGRVMRNNREQLGADFPIVSAP